MWIIKFRFSFHQCTNKNNNENHIHTHTHTWQTRHMILASTASGKINIDKMIHWKTAHQNNKFSVFPKQPSFCFLLLFVFFTKTHPHNLHQTEMFFVALSIESHSNSPNFPFKSLNSYSNNVAKSYTLYVVWFIEVSQYKYYATFCWLGISKQQKKWNLFFNIFQKDSHTQTLPHK